MTSVSNAGKKRGRGKGAGKKRAKNLNRGQVIGVGKYYLDMDPSIYSFKLCTLIKNAYVWLSLVYSL